MGDYTLDYNQEAIYYGAHSSNHPAAIMPQVQMLLDYLPAAAAGSAALMAKYNKTCAGGDAGLSFPSHIAPYGQPASIGPSPNGDQRLRWNGELAMTVLIWDWECAALLTTLYPYPVPLIPQPTTPGLHPTTPNPNPQPLTLMCMH
jgi:hypothetical protein